MHTSERRKHPRHPTWVDARLTTADLTLMVSVIDISIGGLRIHSCRALTPDTRVALNFRIREESVMHGRIRWVLDTLKDGLTVYEIGVEVESVFIAGVQAVGFSEKYRLVRQILGETAFQAAV